MKLKLKEDNAQKKAVYKSKWGGILQFTQEGKFVREYSSVPEAAGILGINVIYIYKCLYGKIKAYRGYQWRYSIDPNFDEGIFDIEPVKNHKGQTVYQFDMRGKFIREYPSISEAAKKNGVFYSAIWACLKRKGKSAGGYQWRLASDSIFKNGIVDIPPRVKYGPNPKAVVQYNLEGKFIKEYPSIKEAMLVSGINYQNILSCAERKIRRAGQYQWRFKTDVVKDSKIMDIGPIPPVSRPDGKKPNKIPDYYLRPICQFRLDGKFIREYPSIWKAAEKTGANRRSIFLCTRKKLVTTAGYQWRFKDDVLIDGKITDIEPTGKMRKRK
jgi:hypothetical protein